MKNKEEVSSMWSIGLTLIILVVLICDAWLYSKGHDGYFFAHKTEAEKKLQAAQIRAIETENTLRLATAWDIYQKHPGRPMRGGGQ